MARTFTETEQSNLTNVMNEVGRIAKQIEQTDRERGTERPPGAALGRIYERLGIHLVAMARAGVPPFHALQLIRAVAEDAEGLDYATMLSLFAAEADQETGEPTWEAMFDEETFN